MGGGWGEGEGAGQLAAALDCLAEKSREKRRVISRERRQEEQPVILDKNLNLDTAKCIFLSTAQRRTKASKQWAY